MSLTIVTGNRIIASLYLTIAALAVSIGYLTTHAQEHKQRDELSRLKNKKAQHEENITIISQPISDRPAKVAFAWQLGRWVDELGLTLSMQPINNDNQAYSVVVIGTAGQLQQLLLRSSQQSNDSGWIRPFRSKLLSLSKNTNPDKTRLRWQLTSDDSNAFLQPLMVSASLSETPCPAAFSHTPPPIHEFADLRLAAIVTAHEARPFAYWQSSGGHYIKSTIGQRFSQPDSIITAISQNKVELEQYTSTDSCNITTKKVIKL